MQETNKIARDNLIEKKTKINLIMTAKLTH